MHTSVHQPQELLSPGERIAEGILSFLNEPDCNDKRWRAPIFRQLPKRFAGIVADVQYYLPELSTSDLNNDCCFCYNQYGQQ